eukprot:721091-Pelagomonas_calceolata.AAC.3
MARLEEASLCAYYTKWAWGFRYGQSHPQPEELCDEWSRHLGLICTVAHNEASSWAPGLCSWRYKLPEHMLRFMLVALCAEIDWAKSHLGHDTISLKCTQFGAVGGQIWSFGGEH